MAKKVEKAVKTDATKLKVAKKSKTEAPKKAVVRAADALLLRESESETEPRRDELVHVYGNGVVCDTENRGHAQPRNSSPLEIVVDATAGYIPLWAKNTTLRWRFQERSMLAFANPEAAKAAIKLLFGEGLLMWEDAAPVKFKEDKDSWDFEIVMRRYDDCDNSGCVLASAFFPDGGRHKLTLYPKMFEQTRKEQLETMCHEIGHIFGLRHFFAKVDESEWPSEVFGEHEAWSIMNYGAKSKLTDDDKADLKTLYQRAWNGALTEINGTPIKLVKPHTAR
jgi:hypothetical protein